MVSIAYNIEISDEAIIENLSRILNQIFSLLPTYEEGKDWIKPCETLIVELLGMTHLFPDQKNIYSLICKLSGLKELGDEIDFLLFRRSIFECCSMVDKIRQSFQKEG